jgi:hypothetical protein
MSDDIQIHSHPQPVQSGDVPEGNEHGRLVEREVMTKRMVVLTPRPRRDPRLVVTPNWEDDAHACMANGSRLDQLNRRGDDVRDRGVAMPRFVPFRLFGATSYEQRIVEGEVQTRNNWHDTYNALSWLTFPRTKMVIAKLSAELLARGGDDEKRHRSPSRDYLTLFDECGLVVLTKNEELAQLLRSGEWQKLFVDRRDEVLHEMAWHLFGHGTHDVLHHPYPGLTTKALLLSAPITIAGDALDAIIADEIERCAPTAKGRDLHPVPLLGIPGLWPTNQDRTFYDDNARYFRSRR